jgi:hypothetical protein
MRWCITSSVRKLASPTSYTGISIGPPTHSGMKKSPTPKTRRSRCLFLVAKISLLTLMFVNLSPDLAGGDLTLFFYSALSDTLNPMVLRRACCIPPNIPTVRRSLTALRFLIRSWGGSQNASKRPSPCSSRLRLFPLYSPVSFTSLDFYPRLTPAECCMIYLYLDIFSVNSFSVNIVDISVTHTLVSRNCDNVTTMLIPLTDFTLSGGFVIPYL